MAVNDTQVGGDHYAKYRIQPWDALEVWLTPEEFRGHLKASAMEYVARCQDKGGVLDIQKAIHTLTKLVEVWK